MSILSFLTDWSSCISAPISYIYSAYLVSRKEQVVGGGATTNQSSVVVWSSRAPPFCPRVGCCLLYVSQTNLPLNTLLQLKTLAYSILGRLYRRDLSLFRFLFVFYVRRQIPSQALQYIHRGMTHSLPLVALTAVSLRCCVVAGYFGFGRRQPPYLVRTCT